MFGTYQPPFLHASVSTLSVIFFTNMQLEMRSQDLQLAETLLGLNTEIQRLRKESFGEVEVEGNDQQ